MLVYVDQIRQVVRVYAVEGNTIYCCRDNEKTGNTEFYEYNIVLGIWSSYELFPNHKLDDKLYQSQGVRIPLGVGGKMVTLTGCGLSILKAIMLGKIDKDQIAQELKARGLKNIPEFKIIKYHSGAYSVESRGTNSWSGFLYSMDTRTPDYGRI